MQNAASWQVIALHFWDDATVPSSENNRVYIRDRHLSISQTCRVTFSETGLFLWSTNYNAMEVIMIIGQSNNSSPGLYFHFFCMTHVQFVRLPNQLGESRAELLQTFAITSTRGCLKLLFYQPNEQCPWGGRGWGELKRNLSHPITLYHPDNLVPSIIAQEIFGPVFSRSTTLTWQPRSFHHRSGNSAHAHYCLEWRREGTWADNEHP